MGALLIGAVMDSTFVTLQEKLRAQTIEYARRKFGRLISAYSPWLCFAPLADEIDSRLMYFSPPVRGGLVLDHDMLALMAEFLAERGHSAIDDLPGLDAEWLPGADNISRAFEGAIPIIDAALPPMRSLYDLTVDYVVPLGGGRNRGYSTHLVRGVLFRSFPAQSDAYDVALDIMHEVGHQVLMTWQSVDPILVSDPSAPVFSQIRRVDRPAIQSFHAAVALAYMRYMELSFLDDDGMKAAGQRRGAAYTESLSHSLGLALEVIRNACVMTDLGSAMIDEMEALI